MIQQEILKFLMPAGVSFIKIIFILIFAKITLYFASVFVKKIVIASSRIKLSEKRATTLTSLIGSVIKYVVWFVAIIMIIKELGFDPVPILAGAGVIGLAVGFGAQTLIKDVISGFFILLEDQFAVGDKVMIGNITGTVEEITLRTTKVRNPEGGLSIIPNGSITQVINYSRSKEET